MLNVKTIQEQLEALGIPKGYRVPDAPGATQIIRAMNSDGFVSELGLSKHWRILMVSLVFAALGLAWIFFSQKNERPELKKETTPRFSNEVPHQKK
jgi:hypothetical protein